MAVSIEIIYGDVAKFKSDLLVLKFAQGLFGADRYVAGILFPDRIASFPKAGEYLHVNSDGKLLSNSVLFIGTVALGRFDYKEIQRFSEHIFQIMPEIGLNDIKHVSMTLHGINYGLDEVAAISHLVLGIQSAHLKGLFPKSLIRISIVEKDFDRVKRLKSVVHKLTNINVNEHTQQQTIKDLHSVTSYNDITTITNNLNSKRSIFVAMPFDDSFTNVFHYGISKPINDNGFLCERVDFAKFTGDITSRIKNCIEISVMVIADLTNSSPNVYLEVGYAWGKAKPTLFIAQSNSDLQFDVKTHRCIFYDPNNIPKLESELSENISKLLT